MSKAVAPVVLILGAGSNIGNSVAKLFAKEGYKVAAVSRSAKDGQAQGSTRVDFAANLSDPKAVADVFQRVKLSLGQPQVVVYNAARATRSGSDGPLALSIEEVTQDLTVNTISAFAAAQEAVTAFSELPDHATKTFIYTGNILNTITMPGFGSLGMGKTASAHFLQAAAVGYADRGFRFYYCDERKADGAPAFKDIDGDAHAEFYFQLANAKAQGDWHQTFVKGVGYKKF